MPVLESTDHMPRSALRHRPIQDESDQQGKHPSTMTSITPVAERASRLDRRPRYAQNATEGNLKGIRIDQNLDFACIFCVFGRASGQKSAVFEALLSTLITQRRSTMAYYYSPSLLVQRVG
jgi:hypothetical protein